MLDDYGGNNNHQYLIGTKPETIRADMRIFKEEVLVDFKEWISIFYLINNYI